MSSSLFSARTPKTRNLRKVSISSPLHVTPPMAQSPAFARAPGWTVVLTAKYSFCASAHPEMSLSKGDHVRLLERPGNGWLKVQRIHEIGEGLVPASYLAIAVNDPANPVSSEWLNDFQHQAALRNSVAKVKVKCAYTSSTRNVWYRMDVHFSTGRTTHCAMFHEDFVAMHAQLAGALAAATEPLPQKQPSLSPHLRATVRGEAVARAHRDVVSGLDRFVQSVLAHAQAHSSSFLGDYVDNHCTRKVHVQSGELAPEDEALAATLVQHSVRLTSGGGPTRNNSFSPTAPLPPLESGPGQADTSFSPRFSPYSAANAKYSSYLNQGLSQSQASLAAVVQKTAKPDRAELTKSIASLNSLLETYAVSSSDSEDEDDEHYELSVARAKTPASAAPIDFSKDIFGGHLNMKNTSKTGSAEFGSERTTSCMTLSTHSLEPRTPTFGHPLTHPSVKVISEYDLSPLEPRKHHTVFSTEMPSASSKFSWDALV